MHYVNEGPHKDGKANMSVYQLVVHSVKSQLTGSVDQVGEADEGFNLVHVQDQHGCRGGHTLHLGERHPERVRQRERLGKVDSSLMTIQLIYNKTNHTKAGPVHVSSHLRLC